ncbi:transcriptional regulator, TetR family [Filimonas lacunae]|nr:transcriptional regulator, TetR family [Filimonas lacunae]
MIVEKAAPIFNIKGMAATAMSDIMEVTGLSKGSMYNHFQDKEMLVSAVVDYNLHSYAGKIRAAIGPEKTAVKKLFAFIDLLGTPLSPIIEGGCPVLNFGTEADDTHPSVATKLNAMIELCENALAGIIKEGIQQKEFDADWNYKEFAVIMFSMMEGGHILSRIAGNNNRMKLISKTLKAMIKQHVIQ